MKRHLTLLIALLGLAGLAARTARAEGPDEKYIWVYTLIQEADGLLNDLQKGAK